MQKTLIVLFVVVCLIAYIESKKYSEGKEGRKENEKHGQKDKQKQKEGQESKGREKRKENVKQKDEQKQKDKYKGKKDKARKDEKYEKATKDAEKVLREESEKATKDAETQQEKKDEKPEEVTPQTESCPKDVTSCEKSPEPEPAPIPCTVHEECQPGSCCKPPGVCQKIDAREGQKCWSTCMCGGGLFCFSDNNSKDVSGICKDPVPEDLELGTYLQ